MDEPVRLSATVPTWEYDCCGDIPNPGVTVHAVKLIADPASSREGPLETRPYEWLPDFELLRFDGFSAHWRPENGDPGDHDIVLRAAWHERGHEASLLPTLTATVTGDVVVHRVTSRVDEDGRLHPIPGSVRAEITRSLKRFDTRTTRPDTGIVGMTVDEVTHVEVQLAVVSSVEPTFDDLAAVRSEREKASRTVYLTGPATAFGAEVPARYGGRVSVDIDDPRIDVTNSRPDGLSGVVNGTAQQVSLAVESGGYTGFSHVPPGTEAASLQHPLFVVLEVDRDCFR